ncbi:MAG: hypothetical protein ABSF60_15400 [Verrucomicrobiota bacterium]
MSHKKFDFRLKAAWGFQPDGKVHVADDNCFGQRKNLGRKVKNALRPGFIGHFWRKFNDVKCGTAGPNLPKPARFLRSYRDLAPATFAGAALEIRL